MNATVRINFHPSAARSDRAVAKPRKHELPKCATTGLARYRDRHQARDGAKALAAGAPEYGVDVFACPDCRGVHVEKVEIANPIELSEPRWSGRPVATRPAVQTRRYVLWDVENSTHGAKATVDQLVELWGRLRAQAPRISPHDHVVVGAARRVVRKYRAAIHEPNVRWVVGADAPDGADRALLAAIDLHRVARDYDQLVIISGDHAFADLARRAKQHGLTVHVVTIEHPEQRTTLSRELAAAADTRTVIRPQPPQPVAAAGIPPATPLTIAGRVHRRVYYATAA